MKYRSHEILVQRSIHDGILAHQVRILDEQGRPVAECWGDAGEEAAIAWAKNEIDVAIAKRADDENFSKAMAEAALAAPRSK